MRLDSLRSDVWSVGRVDDTIAHHRLCTGWRTGAKGDSYVVDSAPPDSEGEDTPRSGGWIARIGADWWAVGVVGVTTVLAVADVLPKIPW
ncbi:MAG: hypothetical protein JWR32_6753 [Mycobacterium sp.]|jgi:hypothetical protein|nr:hypothetical protein [Mycobacterium sp.]